MPRFVLLDNWLDSVGGHNYQYAVEMLQVATAAGHEAVLATAQSFSDRDAFPENWLVRPLFPYTWNRTHSAEVNGKRERAIDIEGRPLPCPAATQGLNRLLAPITASLDLFRQPDRQRRIAAYESACAALFDEIGFHAEDTVFLPSVSEFDFLGLVRFLEKHPQSLALDWHLQFHYDIFHGRAPTHVDQRSRRTMLQRQFATALEHIPQHRIHFYTTTPQIADQYNQLEVGHYQALPYPYSGDTVRLDTAEKQPHTPLRVTLAGGARREKGKHGLAQLIEQICNGTQQENKIQIWAQGDPLRVTKNLPAKYANNITQGKVDAEYDETIVVVPHPLARDDYANLIQQSDIALLPYNNMRYHARASGVLVEMLAAGVPVIVPAGCWLSAQIADSTYAYLDKLRNTTAPAIEPQWDTPSSIQMGGPATDIESDRLVFGSKAHGAVAEISLADVTAATTCHEIIVSFDWKESRPGYFVRLQVEQFGDDGTSLGTPQESVLDERTTPGRAAALVSLDAQAKHLRLTLENAYHDDLIEMGRTEVQWIASGPDGTPAAAVGLIAADLGQIPQLLSEIVEHHEHYRRTAADFAAAWTEEHAPHQTVDTLAANAQAASKVTEAA